MRQRGFTLMELLVTMLILVIIAIGVTSFINFSTRIYVDSQQWGDAVAQQRYGMQRLSLEVRDALPGSMAVTTTTTAHCLTFRPIVNSGHFLEAPVHNNPQQVSIFALDCCTAAGCQACIPDDAGNQFGIAILDGYAVPNPLPKFPNSSCNGDNICTLNLDTALTQGDFSVGKRFYLADNPISYCLQNTGALVRTSGSDVNTMGEGYTNNLAACNLNDRNNEQCPFIIQPPSLARNNVVKLQLWLTQAGQSTRFAQEVQLENVP
ncbi:PilW family protein [Ferrimonas sp. SCSIO 43195]|uniref:PilW family protein n=1 Tax=Ferrimonas sp. SCSIO 43195 TaxID=2822844 RepID=UPI00207539A8|nr:prepilin-type N-terminal cleavage/methylation domain-containing protein [Ferrimonas sp. SCSIO 43195]USD37271.1 prepilin-type N-terminal cleavage/methylation domain-containing protein [Ferrimonas sp. SCSIO 43195]